MPSPRRLNITIVRIYRFEKNKPGGLVRVVEEVGAKRKKAFTNFNEFWDILNSPKGIAPHRRAREQRR
jgi:hypothetical protein